MCASLVFCCEMCFVQEKEQDLKRIFEGYNIAKVRVSLTLSESFSYVLCEGRRVVMGKSCETIIGSTTSNVLGYISLCRDVYSYSFVMFKSEFSFLCGGSP